jgi:hypothetical protein
MSISWFFGSKKKTSDNEPQDCTAKQQGDEFVFVEKAEDLQTGSSCAGPTHYPALPYSLAPDSGIVPQTPLKDTTNVSQNKSFLYQVPFKLHSDIASLISDCVNRNRNHVNEVLLHISQLNLESFDYDFLVERSVVLEAGNRLG